MAHWLLVLSDSVLVQWSLRLKFVKVPSSNCLCKVAWSMQQMMPRTSGIWDRSLLGGKECCSYIFKIASSLVFAYILPLPDHGYPSVCFGQRAALNFKERRQIFEQILQFVFPTCLNFLCVPALYPSCFCNSNMPLFLNLASLSWCPGLGAWSISLCLPQQNSLWQRGFIPILPGQDHKPTHGGASSPSSVSSLICDGFPIMGRDYEIKERHIDGERYLRAARAAVWDLWIRWRQDSTTLSFPTLDQDISHVQSKTSPTPAMPF